MFQKMRTLLVTIVLALGLVATVGSGTASAVGAGPQVWEFGNQQDTCTGRTTWHFDTNKQTCDYYENDSTFQLGSPDGTLQYKAAGLGSLIGRYDTGGAWLNSQTVSGTSTEYFMSLQPDCNIVIRRAYDKRAMWATGSQSTDPNRTDCRIRMGVGYFYVDMYSSGTKQWHTQCQVPKRTFPVTCATGPR